jgi:hypothetical protein
MPIRVSQILSHLSMLRERKTRRSSSVKVRECGAIRLEADRSEARREGVVPSLSEINNIEEIHGKLGWICLEDPVCN